MSHYKNKPNKFIVVYGENEKDGVEMAMKFVMKGFHNTVLLKGGI